MPQKLGLGRVERPKPGPQFVRAPWDAGRTSCLAVPTLSNSNHWFANHSATQTCDDTMPIRLDCEELLTLTQAAAYCPRRRAGRKPHASTLYRWAIRGFRGVYLETLQTPSGMVTTKETLTRFFVELKRVRYPRIPQRERVITEQEHQAVEAELKRRFRI
jgi:hypothetical protein